MKKKRSRRTNRIPKRIPQMIPACESNPVSQALEPSGNGQGPPRRHVLTAAAEASQLIATVLAVVGLALAVWELQGLRRATEATALVGIYGASNEINRFLVQYPDYRDHFYADDPSEAPRMRNERLTRQLEDLASADAQQYRLLMSFAELEADQFEQVFSLRDAMPQGQWEAWWEYFVDTYNSSPLLRKFYERNSNWYELDDFLEADAAMGRTLKSEQDD